MGVRTRSDLRAVVEISQRHYGTSLAPAWLQDAGVQEGDDVGLVVETDRVLVELKDAGESDVIERVKPISQTSLGVALPPLARAALGVEQGDRLRAGYDREGKRVELESFDLAEA